MADEPNQQQQLDDSKARVLALLDEAGESGMTTVELACAVPITRDGITYDDIDHALYELMEVGAAMMAGIHTICYIARAHTEN